MKRDMEKFYQNQELSLQPNHRMLASGLGS